MHEYDHDHDQPHHGPHTATVGPLACELPDSGKVHRWSVPSMNLSARRPPRTIIDPNRTPASPGTFTRRWRRRGTAVARRAIASFTSPGSRLSHASKIKTAPTCIGVDEGRRRRSRTSAHQIMEMRRIERVDPNALLAIWTHRDDVAHRKVLELGDDVACAGASQVVEDVEDVVAVPTGPSELFWHSGCPLQGDIRIRCGLRSSSPDWVR
jgi:hypothetical protein